MVLDPQTFKGSPPYEVPTRPHTVLCGSPIRYDDLVSIVLRICLKSCLSTQESGFLCLWEVRFTCLVSVSVLVPTVLSLRREESEGEFQVERDQSQLSQEHTTQRTCTTSGGAVDLDAAVISYKVIQHVQHLQISPRQVRRLFYQGSSERSV